MKHIPVLKPPSKPTSQAPIIPRVPCADPIPPQPDCAFLTLLPAEIRNEIYIQVFSTSTTSFKTNTAHEEDYEPHPLSLLLTCRQINTEASILAYNLTTFALPPSKATYHSLSLLTAHLPRPLFSAIGSVSLGGEDVGRLELRLANTLLLFGGVEKVFVDIEMPSKEDMWWRRSSAYEIREGLFGRMLGAAIRGHCVSWQRGSKWEVEKTKRDVDDEAWMVVAGEEGLEEEEDEQEEVKECVLVQEGGRRIEVSAAFREKVVEEKVVLELGKGPGAFGFMGDEAFWERKRAEVTRLKRRWSGFGGGFKIGS